MGEWGDIGLLAPGFPRSFLFNMTASTLDPYNEQVIWVTFTRTSRWKKKVMNSEHQEAFTRQFRRETIYNVSQNTLPRSNYPQTIFQKNSFLICHHGCSYKK